MKLICPELMHCEEVKIAASWTCGHVKKAGLEMLIRARIDEARLTELENCTK